MNKISIDYRLLLPFLLVLAVLMQPLGTTAQTPISITGAEEVCLGDERTYIPLVIDDNYDYHWDVIPASGGAGIVLFGNSSGANIQWFAPGTATITLEVTEGGVPVYEGTLLVTILELPAPYILSDVMLGCQRLDEDTARRPISEPLFNETNCHLVCANSTVRYTASEAGGSSSFSWSVTGAVSYSVVSPGVIDVTWGTPGAGSITLTETTDAGCSASHTICIEIIERPVALFIPVPAVGDPIRVCRFGEVVLMDASTGSDESPIVSWHWDWGDGHSNTTSPGSVGTPVSHQYETPGNYVITLTVTNACGCKAAFQRLVVVMPAEGPTIACPRVVCAGEITTYSVDDPCPDYSWNVIGGTILADNPAQVTVRWDAVDPATGFGYVSYTSQCNPCPTTVTEEVPVIVPNGVIQGPSNICLGEQYVYRMPKWPATEFDWEIISGTATLEPTDQRNEIALTTTVAGPLILRVTYRNTVLRCGGTAQISLNVRPQALITGPAGLCQGETGNFMISSGTAAWTLRDATGTIIATGSGPSFSYAFANPGNYRLSATSSTLCPPDDFLIKVIPTPEPPAGISGPDRACTDIPVRFEAGPPIPGTTFLWGGNIRYRQC